MNKMIPLSVALTALLSVHTNTQAQNDQVYSWTDENGITHYVDTPPNRPDAVAREIRGSGTRAGNNNDPYTDVDSETGAEEAGDQTPQLSPGQLKREQLAQKRSQRQNAQAERDQRCAIASAQLNNIEPSRRVFYTNDAGETVRMDDEQRVQEIERLKQIIAEDC